MAPSFILPLLSSRWHTHLAGQREWGHGSQQGGTVSRIVPKLGGPVTTPRNDVHWIVTEHGAANLRGQSLRERAELLIGLADPKFRDSVAKAL